MHVNALEFIVVALQLAAVHVRIATMTDADWTLLRSLGRPDTPSWWGQTDNDVAKSWENWATASVSVGGVWQECQGS